MIAKLQEATLVPTCIRCERHNIQLSKAYVQVSTALALLDRFLECDWYDTGLQVPDDLMADAYDFNSKNSPKAYS